MARTKEQARRRPILAPVASSDSDSDSSFQVNYNSDSTDDDLQSASTTVVPSADFTLSDPSALNCPICTHPLTIPVYQCEDGHFSCQSCCDQIEDKCPTCNKQIGNKRCSGMEKVIQSFKTSCKIAENGCLKKMRYCKKLDHEKSCKYTPVPCPCIGCNYVGVVESFYNHYVEKHPYSCKLIKFNHVKSVKMGEDVYLLFEEKRKILFFLYRVIDPLGSFVCVYTAPTASNIKFAYDLTAISGQGSVSMKSFVEITTKCFARPAKEKGLLITNNIHRGARNHTSRLRLHLVIRKVRV